MKSSAASNAVDSNQREAYYRGRDDPFFDGMRRGEAALVRKGSAIDFQGNLATKISYRSASDVGDRKSRNIIDAITEEAYNSPKNSPWDIVLEPIGRSSSGRCSKISSPLVVTRADVNIDVHEVKESLVMASKEIIVKLVDSGIGRNESDNKWNLEESLDVSVEVSGVTEVEESESKDD